MKFLHDSDERSCPKPIPTSKWYGDLACMRVAGHEGECIAEVGEAAHADGVLHCCRVPLGAEHREDCLSLLCFKVLDDVGDGQARACGLVRDHAGACVPWTSRWAKDVE